MMRTMVMWLAAVLMADGLWGAPGISQALADELAAPSSVSGVTGGAAGTAPGKSETAPPGVEEEPAPPPDTGEVRSRAVPEVVLYEHANFGGRSLSLGVGDYRFYGGGDFNDLTSAIKVSPGLVALLYEHADAGGGYGRSVDLLEDRPDLAQLNFNDAVSYLRVFSSPNPQGYIWVRGSIQNGQYVPGHWERPRVRGTPINTVAVVSPPLPPNITITQPPVTGPIIGPDAPVLENPIPPPPAAPTNPRVTGKGAFSMHIAWGDNSSDEQGFEVHFWLKTLPTRGNYYFVLANQTTWGLSSGLKANTEYCFTVKAKNRGGYSTPTPTVCDRTNSSVTGPIIGPDAPVLENPIPPPPAAPSNPRVTDVTSTSLNLAWQDNSSDETGFIVVFWKEVPGAIYKEYRTSANQTTMTRTGLEPNAKYCFNVSAINNHGRSAKTGYSCGTTGSSGGGGPQEKTFDLSLGFDSSNFFGTYPPYQGKFPLVGSIPNGNLKQITNLGIPSGVRIGFVRINHSAEECGDPNAVVPLASGQSTTPEMMKNIYGTSTPSLSPVFFVACVDNVDSFPPSVWIRITYTE